MDGYTLARCRKSSGVARVQGTLPRLRGCFLVIAAHGDQDRVGVEPFDAIEIELSTLWPDPVVESS